MKSKLNKKRICKAQNGLNVGDALSDPLVISGLSQLLSMFGGKSNATTDSLVVQTSISDVLSGGISGAQIGTSIAPGIGTAIGAGAGILAGSIGKSGTKANMTSFTDYDEGTLSTGLTGLFGGNSKLKRRRNLIKQNAYANKAAVAGTNNLQVDFDLDYGNLNTNTFNYGGAIPLQLAYVDDGELLQMPNGNVKQVPELGKPTDSNLMNLPIKTKVLSNTLKVPGTTKTFSELGNELMSTSNTAGNDRFADNSRKLNKKNNDYIYNLLFVLQELLKWKKNIKPLTKELDANDEQINKNDMINHTEKRLKLNKTRKFAKGGIADPLYKDILSVASLYPILSNIFTGDYTSVSDVLNPYASGITKLMRNRRYDIDPALLDIKTNRSINRYNLSLINTNTGANMAYGIQSAVNQDKLIESLYSLQNNANNQYDADYANTLNSLGLQWVNAINLSRNTNMQSAANIGNIRRTGLSQLSQYALNSELMSNQANRDNAMLQLYKPLLDAGFNQNEINEIYNKYVKGGNSYGK